MSLVHSPESLAAATPGKAVAALDARTGRGLRAERWRGAAGLLVFCVLWEAGVYLKLLHPLFFSPIETILAATWDMYSSGEIYPHLAYTLTNFVSGFVLAVCFSLPIGLALGWYRKALHYCDWVLSIALATPVIVLVPLVIAVFGIFWQSKVAITTWAVFFPVLVSMVAGVQSADSGLIKVARSFQASDYMIIRQIVLPGAVPTLMSGLRLGLTRGLIGVLAAEFFGAPRGLGFLAFSYASNFQPAKMYVSVLTMAVISIVITEGMKVLQTRFDAWRPDPA